MHDDNLPLEDGYELWLRYRRAPDTPVTIRNQQLLEIISMPGMPGCPVRRNAAAELTRAIAAILGRPPVIRETAGDAPAGLIIATRAQLREKILAAGSLPPALGEDGFLIRPLPARTVPALLLSAETARGLLFGVFHLLQRLRLGDDLAQLDEVRIPDMQHRLTHHWDNPNGTIERGYAGPSLWQWAELPGQLDQRYTDYFRANASVGINGVVLNNVNADPCLLSRAYLLKIKPLADLARGWGQRIYLSPYFDAPMRLGGLATSNPLTPEAEKWWADKIAECYRYIPDFGGFVIKADSEGQPGPEKYDITPVQAANVFGRLLQPHRGLFFWRTFTGNLPGEDRCCRDFDRFKHCDGPWEENVFLLAKYGPHDFHVNEPFHPLLAALRQTNFAFETQTANEHRGQSNCVFYNGMLWRDYLDRDTFKNGPGSPVKSVYRAQRQSAWINVAGIGADRNWLRNHLDQLNWFTAGAFAWDLDCDPAALARDWTRLTFGDDARAREAITRIVTQSWEARRKYTGALGQMKVTLGSQYHPVYLAEWLRHRAVNFHRSDETGIGFRLDDQDPALTANGRAVQYPSPLKEQFGSLTSCPAQWIAWFHHAPYRHLLPDGRTVIETLYRETAAGVDLVEAHFRDWCLLEQAIDARRFCEQLAKMWIQVHHALVWEHSTFAYFSKLAGVAPPDIGHRTLPGRLYAAAAAHTGARERSAAGEAAAGQDYLVFETHFDRFLTFAPDGPGAIEWEVAAATAGRHYLIFKYHTPPMRNCAADIQVNCRPVHNGLSDRTLDFRYITGHGKTIGAGTSGRLWSAEAVPAELQPGSNRVRLSLPRGLGTSIESLAVLRL